MPAAARSLRVTDAYRERLAGIRERAERDTEASWPSIENFDTDSEPWLTATARRLEAAQREAIRTTEGYLSAFLSTELGLRTNGPRLDSARWAGKARDDRSLTDALRSVLTGTLWKLAQDGQADEATAFGLDRAKTRIELDLMHAARESLRAGLEADERIEGWQRAVKGTCGACMGEANGATLAPGESIDTHPNCQCVTEPKVTTRFSDAKAAAASIRERLTFWKKDALPADLVQAEKTWAKRLDGLLSTDNEIRKVIEDAVESNKASPAFQRLIQKYGGGKDNIVIVDSAAARSDALLHLEAGVAQRLGGTTFVSDGAVLQNLGRWDGALRHEFAHSVYDAIPTALRTQFQERLATLPRRTIANRTDRLEFTDYQEAWSRDDEAFCEAVRVVFAPDFDPSGFSPQFQELAKWLRRSL